MTCFMAENVRRTRQATRSGASRTMSFNVQVGPPQIVIYQRQTVLAGEPRARSRPSQGGNNPMRSALLSVLMTMILFVSVSCSAGSTTAPVAAATGALTDAPVSSISPTRNARQSGREMDAGPMNSTPFSGSPMPMSTGNNGHQHSSDSSQGGVGTPNLGP